MSNNKLIVSLETIKANSNIEHNAEPNKLSQAALEAQRVEVKSILGTSLLNVFLNAVNDDGVLTGLTAIQETFHEDYLVPMFSKYAEAQFIYTTHYQISNVGVTNTAASNTRGATDDAVDKVYKRAMNSADFHAERAKRFILLPENNTDLGVFYWASNQNIQPQAKVQQGFIYTPSGRAGSGDCCPPIN